MIKIEKANKNHIQSIITLARITWQASYANIISQKQIEFMLDKLYDEQLIDEQMNMPNHYFNLAVENEKVLAYSHCLQENEVYKLSKLYVLPNMHGKGLGRMLLEKVNEEASMLGCKIISLNVNRNNPAKNFYLSMGFQIKESIDIPFDTFWLNDYIMEKKVSSSGSSN